MDQALLTFHNQLSQEVHVFYTSDFCYKVRRFLRLQDTARKTHSVRRRLDRNTQRECSELNTAETEEAEHFLKLKRTKQQLKGAKC